MINSFPKYQKFVDVVEDLKLKEKLNLNMEDLFDEVTFIQKHFDTIQSTELFRKCETTSSKWHFILKSNDFKCVNILKTISFVLSIPGSSAYCERIFSVMSSKWRNKRNRCSVEIIKNELFIYFNFKEAVQNLPKKQKMTFNC